MYLTYTSRMMEYRQDGYEEGFDEGREAGFQVGIEQGIVQGIARGAYETKLETAKAFLSMKLSPEQVAHGTNLPLDVVMELVENPADL